VAHSWPNQPGPDAIEEALAIALRSAVDEHQWDRVGQLTEELKARRLARAGNVVPLNSGRNRGTRS
jgi:hypothetical protein